MKEFQIDTNEAGQRLDKYLHKLLPQAGNSFLYKMLRKKNIVLNHKKAAGNERIAGGDLVTLFLSDETFEKFSSGEPVITTGAGSLDILYEDRHILAIHKPAGMLSQKAAASDISANELIIRYLLDSGQITKQQLRTFRPSICNRLDRNTSGILIAGKTLEGLQTMAAQLKDHSLQKYYCCIVQGNLTQPGELKGWHRKDPQKNKVHIFSKRQPDCQYIETRYRPLEQYDGYTFLEVRLITGRSHQIRAHLSCAGHGIAGDPKYGDASVCQLFLTHASVNRQLLHAHRIILKDGREIVAPLPADFLRAQQFLKG